MNIILTQEQKDVIISLFLNGNIYLVKNNNLFYYEINFIEMELDTNNKIIIKEWLKDRCDIQIILKKIFS